MNTPTCFKHRGIDPLLHLDQQLLVTEVYLWLVLHHTDTRIPDTHTQTGTHTQVLSKARYIDTNTHT
jgi:hypothetical protein